MVHDASGDDDDAHLNDTAQEGPPDLQARPTDATEDEHDAGVYCPPVVLVHGFLGTGRWYWGCAVDDAQWQKTLGVAGHRTIVTEVGPTSSLHDRACELFYQLKGGRVDYGAAHAETAGHERFGRTYEGLFPEWSERASVHIVGHSLGGVTARALQQLLAEGAFPGHATSAAWVRSICTIFSPNRGSTTTYILGTDATADGGVVPLSAGWLGMKFVHAYEYFDSEVLRRRFVDFHFGHWRLPSRHRSSSVIGAARSLLSAVAGPSRIFEGRDNAPYDMSIAGMARWNARTGRGHAGTLYLSVVSSVSVPLPLAPNYHVPPPTASPLLLGTALLIGCATVALGQAHGMDIAPLPGECEAAVDPPPDHVANPDIAAVVSTASGQQAPIARLVSFGVSLARASLCTLTRGRVKGSEQGVAGRGRPVPKRTVSRFGYCAEDWRENDGMCSRKSQAHPHATCNAQFCRHARVSVGSLAKGFRDAVFEPKAHVASHAYAKAVPVTHAHNRDGHHGSHSGHCAPSAHVPRVHAAHDAHHTAAHAHAHAFRRSHSIESPSASEGPLWRVLELHGVGHTDIVPFPRSEAVQRDFFEGLFRTLRMHDIVRAAL